MRNLLTITSLFILVGTTSCIALPTDTSDVTVDRAIVRTAEGALKQVETATIEITAAIEQINIKERLVSLKTPNGNIQEFKVSPQVERLAEFKVGDKIVLEYTEALAFSVRKPTAEEIKQPRAIAAGAMKNDLTLPAGVEVGMASHTIVEIENIDLENNKVTVKLPEGNSTTIVARFPENLTRIKVGDTVAVTYVQAIAVGISPAKS